MIPAVFICVCVCIIVCLMLLIIILKSLSEDWLCWYCSLLVFIATIPVPGLYVNCLYYVLFLWRREKKGETFDSFLSKGRRELLKVALCWQWCVLLCSFLAGERAPFHTCFVSWINNFLGNWQLRRYSCTLHRKRSCNMCSINRLQRAELALSLHSLHSC